MSEVRLAVPADADSIYEMLTEDMWAENAIFRFSEARVRHIINVATQPQNRQANDPLVVIGVIGAPGKVEASTGLLAAQFWYTDEWHLEDIWHFVRPDFRKTDHIKQLFEFSKAMQAQLGLPLIVGVLSDIRTEAKVRLYEREFGKAVGGVFVWPAVETLKTQVRANAA